MCSLVRISTLLKKFHYRILSSQKFCSTFKNQQILACYSPGEQDWVKKNLVLVEKLVIYRNSGSTESKEKQLQLITGIGNYLL